MLSLSVGVVCYAVPLLIGLFTVSVHLYIYLKSEQRKLLILITSEFSFVALGIISTSQKLKCSSSVAETTPKRALRLNLRYQTSGINLSRFSDK